MYKRLTTAAVLIPILIAVLFSCAKISTPSGGPKDRTPPVVVKSTPPNGTKNFKGHRLETEFDEYIVLDNINEKFMVSPPLKKKPTVQVRGKSVRVDFEEKLKDSTTYTFYFQDAIQDLNEKNVLPNFQEVISTGPVIDSLSVNGNLYNANNLEVPEKTTILMYRDLADSAVKKKLPEYITRVDETGYFRIDNVRPGTYRLYGLKDNDNSKNYNLPDEDFAFMDTLIKVTPEKNFLPPPPVKKDSIVIKKRANKNSVAVSDTAKKVIPPPLKGVYALYLFPGIKKAHYLSSSRREQKYLLTYVLSLPPDTMKFDFYIPEIEKNNYFIEPTKNRDTIRVWLTDSTLFSQIMIRTIVRFPFTDSLGITGYKQDTVPMRYTFPRPSRSGKVKRVPFTFETNIRSGTLKPGHQVYFTSKTPFTKPDTSRIRLYEIAKDEKTRLPYSFIPDSVTSTRYFLKAKIEQGKKYLLITNKGSFGNIYRETSDSAGFNFVVKDPESYCKLTLNITNYSGDRIIQLMDKTEKLVAQLTMKKEGKAVFPLLEPGIYRVKVIYDINGDGKWTTGDFALKRQPEPVSYYPGEIELKTGWDLEQPWDIGKLNFKDWKLLEKKKK